MTTDDMNRPGPIPAFRADCPCRKKKCARHGRCEECSEHHASKDKLPYCLRKGRQMVEAVLFDNDGVLVDTETAFFEVTREAFAE